MLDCYVTQQLLLTCYVCDEDNICFIAIWVLHFNGVAYVVRNPTTVHSFRLQTRAFCMYASDMTLFGFAEP